MSNYISVRFQSTPEQSEIIAALLMDTGYEAAEEKEGETIVSIKEGAFDEAALKSIMDQFDVSYTFNKVAQQNWNAQWESSFEPVEVGGFALIRASFHEPKKDILHDIIVTPKMSFGTGHHATTYLMIEQMSTLDFNNKSVIDFGTGTGVLAILAEKMGASRVLAIDNDEWSINNLKENAEANHCTKIEPLLANEMTTEKKAAIILANINFNVIIANLPKIKAAAENNAFVLFSGLLREDEENISLALKDNGFQIVKISHRNGWISLLTSV